LLKRLSEFALFIPPEIGALHGVFVVLCLGESAWMMRTPVGGPPCQSTAVVKYGKTPEGTQRFHGRNLAGQRQTFLLESTKKGF
jgi:hypothetical protein